MGVYYEVYNMTKRQLLNPSSDGLSCNHDKWVGHDKEYTFFQLGGTSIGGMMLDLLSEMRVAELNRYSDKRIDCWAGDTLMVAGDYEPEAMDSMVEFDDITDVVWSAKLTMYEARSK